MKYTVFEAGSRAGYSAEYFFRAWKRRHPQSDTGLILADSDPTYALIPATDGIVRMPDTEAIALALSDDNVRLFPGDELTRQKSAALQKRMAGRLYEAVEPWYYQKSEMNKRLAAIVGDDSPVIIPRTFEYTNVCVKPDSLSAGSRGVEFKEKVCVSELIDIVREYVVDVAETDGRCRIFAREVKLRCGYDKLVRLLPQSHPLVAAVDEFVSRVNAGLDASLFHGVFHLQIAENPDGKFYFIECSKRISGTAIVNIFRGFNPFDVLEGTAPTTYDVGLDEDRWYRFEDFTVALDRIV